MILVVERHDHEARETPTNEVYHGPKSTAGGNT
jgi:hypothetical protein